MSCGTIDIGSSADCDNLPLGGTRARAIVINYDDIQSYNESGDIITAIILKPGKVAYEFTGFRDDIKSSQEVVKPDVGVTQFKHNFSMTIYERTQVQKNNVERLTRGLFVVIVEDKGKDSTAFDVLGIDFGLEINAGAIRNAHENGGFFILSFSTPED